MAELQNKINQGVTTFMRKNNSPRGCECVPAHEIKIGDKIVIDNYFTEVIDAGSPKMNNKELETITMPDLQGSEKQIAWAEEIRQKQINGLSLLNPDFYNFHRNTAITVKNALNKYGYDEYMPDAQKRVFLHYVLLLKNRCQFRPT